MFALILFMVTLISMVQGLEQSSLDRFVAAQSGGYDVVAYTTTYGEIPNFRTILMQNFSEDEFLNGWNGVASASVLPAQIVKIGGNRTYNYTVWGVDNFLVKSNQYGFYSNLPYITDENGTRHDLLNRTDVWLSLRENHTLAIIDRSAAAEGIKVFIGSENPFFEMQECSLVVGSYKVGSRAVGTLGVIGPTRMQYKQVIHVVDYTSRLLSRLLSERFQKGIE